MDCFDLKLLIVSLGHNVCTELCTVFVCVFACVSMHCTCGILGVFLCVCKCVILLVFVYVCVCDECDMILSSSSL